MLAPEHLVNLDGGLARRIYDEVVFFSIVQTGVPVARVALQTRNSRELLESVLEIGEPPEPQDAKGSAEDLGRIERDSALDDPIFQIKPRTLSERSDNTLCV